MPASLRPCAYWAIDTHLNFARSLRRAQSFGFVFAAQKQGATQLRAAGVRNCHWLPLACDPEIHGRLAVEKTYDVAFVGHPFPGPRQQLLDQVRRHFLNCFIGPAPHTQLGEIYSRARIVINCCLNNDLNMRVFEALAGGALLITNRLEDNGQEELFADRAHLVEYRSPEEALALIDYYLRHPQEREAKEAALIFFSLSRPEQRRFAQTAWANSAATNPLCNLRDLRINTVPFSVSIRVHPWAP